MIVISHMHALGTHRPHVWVYVCRPDFVIDSTFDLFCELCATDEQCDFPVVYASGVNGIAGGSPETLAEDLAPLFEAIVKEVRVVAAHLCVLVWVE